MMEKETHELLAAARQAVNYLYDHEYGDTYDRLKDAIAAFEAAQAKHPEHVMFIKADDGARTR
jgi:hypothetical protein